MKKMNFLSLFICFAILGHIEATYYWPLHQPVYRQYNRPPRSRISNRQPSPPKTRPVRYPEPDYDKPLTLRDLDNPKVLAAILRSLLKAIEKGSNANNNSNNGGSKPPNKVVTTTSKPRPKPKPTSKPTTAKPLSITLKDLENPAVVRSIFRALLRAVGGGANNPPNGGGNNGGNSTVTTTTKAPSNTSTTAPTTPRQKK